MPRGLYPPTPGCAYESGQATPQPHFTSWTVGTPRRPQTDGGCGTRGVHTQGLGLAVQRDGVLAPPKGGRSPVTRRSWRTAQLRDGRRVLPFQEASAKTGPRGQGGTAGISCCPAWARRTGSLCGEGQALWAAAVDAGSGMSPKPPNDILVIDEFHGTRATVQQRCSLKTKQNTERTDGV